jgi:hypothetical protein
MAALFGELEGLHELLIRSGELDDRLEPRVDVFRTSPIDASLDLVAR